MSFNFRIKKNWKLSTKSSVFNPSSWILWILTPETQLTPQYTEYLLSTLPTQLVYGLRIAVIGGNGAASHIAPELFRMAGAHVTALHNCPNGKNINLHCGALHVDPLARAVDAEKADAGVAFDGKAIARSWFPDRAEL